MKKRRERYEIKEEKESEQDKSAERGRQKEESG